MSEALSKGPGKMANPGINRRAQSIAVVLFALIGVLVPPYSAIADSRPNPTAVKARVNFLLGEALTECPQGGAISARQEVSAAALARAQNTGNSRDMDKSAQASRDAASLAGECARSASTNSLQTAAWLTYAWNLVIANVGVDRAAMGSEMKTDGDFSRVENALKVVLRLDKDPATRAGVEQLRSEY
jgi:hypothetical protein